MEVRLQSMRRFEFNLEAEYHSPELSHDDLDKSNVLVQDRLAESTVPLEDTADNDGLAVPEEDIIMRDRLVESNIPVRSTTMKDEVMKSNFHVEGTANKDGTIVPNVPMEAEAKRVGLTESNSLMEISEYNVPMEDTSERHGPTESNASMELTEKNVSLEDVAKKDELIESNVCLEDTGTKVGLTKSNVPVENTAMKVGQTESDVSMEIKCMGDGVLEVGMEFESEEQAYDFYNQYGRKMGFSVRKDWLNKSKNGIVQSRRYCCSKEGYRRKDPREICLKNPSKETRTGCLAHMIIALQPNGKYRVIQLEAIHNHEFVSPDKAQLLKSQKKLAPAQVARIEKADTFAMLAVGGQGIDDQKITYPPVYYMNYLQSKRMKAMKRGDAGGLLQYFQRMQLENSFFFYAIQLDMFDQITNIFWTDAKMVVDYDHFGDVVCFDMTYGTNTFNWPFALFTGVNHHKQTVFFGAALLYDETTESFKWLFETFIEAMFKKVPKTILTDQCEAMAKAIAVVLPETYHRFCVWQIYQNALVHHLTTVFGGSKSFDKDFSNCIFEHEEEEDFIQAWESMLDKYDLRGNTWLQKLFEEKEKWALAYGRVAFCADMKSTQFSESMYSVLRNHLNREPDLVNVFAAF
ncbi:protein FAR1-RELATED SEQUENCE 5-like [Macadamia integrifolia]|uniref:protein FAR1-RELATED SEQUENCE 5-like n=1 Tax=Macadamia integrifolia TaxID=60698 RepID=UPI001C4F051C|nr:protein FAR1-RELATED SEQUENCE 5-like [Macadamia integrifolia]XP_042516106.1 protein FAR1-RELATED SEQUENCE 5-like [Macadamia integrifolia]XP_042516107.1 protein FAR1-RELATED SEQUENCE 5-like [Macadamia integrifolia]